MRPVSRHWLKIPGPSGLKSSEQQGLPVPLVRSSGIKAAIFIANGIGYVLGSCRRANPKNKNGKMTAVYEQLREWLRMLQLSCPTEFSLPTRTVSGKLDTRTSAVAPLFALFLRERASVKSLPCSIVRDRHMSFSITRPPVHHPPSRCINLTVPCTPHMKVLIHISKEAHALASTY